MQIPIPSLEWKITKRCNYKCSYCCQKQPIIKNGKHSSRETVDAVLKFMDDLPEPYLVKLIGGEPLIHPDFFDICQHISQAGHRLCMTTNFSLPLQKFEHLVDITGNSFAFITASLHLEQITSVEQFIEKAAAFNSKKHPNTEFTVTSVCTEENFDVLKEVFYQLEAKGVRFKFQWMKSNGKFSEYPEKIEQFISDKLIENVTQLKDADLFGTLCHSGELFFLIDEYGSVKRCYSTQPIYDLGNIVKGTFKPLKEAKPCLASKCTCTVPANRGMILFGQKAGKYTLAKSYCESWIRKLRKH